MSDYCERSRRRKPDLPRRGSIVALPALVAALFLSHVAWGSVQVTRCSPVNVGGHAYSVSATNISGSFARSWVGKLAGKRLGAHSAGSVALAGGPSGYTCRAGTKSRSVHMPDIASNVQVSGNCAKGPAGLGGFGGHGPYFNWVVHSTF